VAPTPFTLVYQIVVVCPLLFLYFVDRVFQTGRNISDQSLEVMPMFHDHYLPDWNYTAVPQIY
jgi:hypothetical protein